MSHGEALLDVLVLDANAIHRKRIARGLAMYANASHRCAEAAEGLRGLRLFEERPFDCIVVAESLADISGLELLSRLAKSHAVVPAIFVADTADAELEQDARARGALAFLSKTRLSAFELTRAVDAVLLETRRRARAHAGD